MKIILLILLFPLVQCICGLPKISVSCFLLGEWGCDVKCSLKCLLLGCVTNDATCDGWSHCHCHELYNMGDIILTNEDFENLDFIELWNRIFMANDASAKILERIKKDDDLECYLLNLLRDTYMTGDDIIYLLKQKYPTWKTLNSLVSLQHGWKTEIMEPGKHIQYNELAVNMDKLLDLIETISPDDLDKSQYKLRVTNLLSTITKVEDLEEILYLVKLSGNQSLYRLVKSSLKNLGYGFEEDGDYSAGKKAILHSISVDLEDADDDEKLEIAVAKKFIPKKSNSDSNVLNLAPAPVQYSETNHFPWKTSGLSTAANNGYENSYWNSVGYYVPGYPVAGYAGYGNAISSGGQQINSNTSTPKMFVLVVDANGNVVQATEMPKNVELSPA